MAGVVAFRANRYRGEREAYDSHVLMFLGDMGGASPGLPQPPDPWPADPKGTQGLGMGWQ